MIEAKAKYVRSNLTIVASSPWVQHSFQSRSWHSIASPSCHAWQPPNYGSSCSLISSLSLQEIVELETCKSSCSKSARSNKKQNERRTNTKARDRVPNVYFLHWIKEIGNCMFPFCQTTGHVWLRENREKPHLVAAEGNGKGNCPPYIPVIFSLEWGNPASDPPPWCEGIPRSRENQA